MSTPLKTIVIADDERGLRELLAKVLAQAGYSILACAENGQEAIQAVRQHKPDLILMDVHMPMLDGLEASKTIIPLGSTAVVFLTADQDPVTARQAMDFGASGYMTKPFELTQLVPIVESAWHRFQVVKGLQSEMKVLQDNLETRKLLEKAKGILMEQQGYTEAEAHRTIQRMSQDQGISVKELCRSLIQVRMVLGMKPKTAASRKAA